MNPLYFTGFLLILSLSWNVHCEEADFLIHHWKQPSATSSTIPNWSQLELTLTPKACGTCHASQYREWQQSLHAKAFSPGLMGQFNDLGEEQSNACLNCHAPLKEQAITGQQQLTEQTKELLAIIDKSDSTQLQTPHLSHSGVNCAACHVRNWQRYGPPLRNHQHSSKKNTHYSGDFHNGFNARAEFEQSQFCASCHQFPENEGYEVNGKPLENTLVEWRQSSFAKKNISCQTCHMPDRKHLFKGIHSPDMVKKGLVINAQVKSKVASLRLNSVWIGHAFPTYVTPKVNIYIQALDSKQQILSKKHWSIMREVRFENEWIEQSDTRLMPEEHRTYHLTNIPLETTSIHFKIEIIPDYLYQQVYQELLQDDLDPDARKLIESALKQAVANNYILYRKIISVTKK